MPSEDPIMLLKFLEGKYADLLLRQGEIFMNLLSNHRQAEGNKERQDAHEGAVSNIYLKNPVLTIQPDGFKEGKVLNVSQLFINNHQDVSELRTYSLIALRRSDFGPEGVLKLDPSLKEFGDKFVLFVDHLQFMKRIASYLNSNRFFFEHDFVSYYNRTNNYEALTPFHKNDRFKHQKEYRIVVNYGSPGPLKFRIGSIEDIARIYDSESIDNLEIKLNTDNIVLHF